MTTGLRWSRAALPWRPTLDGIVVATVDEETILSGSTAVVWDVLEHPRTEAELALECRRAYDLDPEDAAAGLAALVEAGLCRTT